MMIDHFPDVVRIEAAGYCNFRCVYCPVGVEGGKRPALAFNDFMCIMEGLPLTPRVLVLYHGGEPLLNKSIIDMINYANWFGVRKVILNTNASLIKPEMDFSRLDEMRISFAGYSPEENDMIRKGGVFYALADKVIAMSKTAHRPRQIVILSVGTGRIANYLLDYFASNGCETGIVFEGLKTKEWARVENEPRHINREVDFCRNLFTTFTILSNGDVVMCNDDLMGDCVQGNIFQNSAIELWEKMQPIRDAFRRKEYPRICQSCWVLTG